MLDKVCKFIDENKMIAPGDKVVLGISGGADSVCLLFVLLEYKKHVDFNLQAVHVNHMIRGAEAKSDEEYVNKLCNTLGVDCDIIYVDIPKLVKETGLSSEEAGRIERYRIFNEYNPDKIAVAHHLDDMSETIIFNMVRGSGLKGVCSIRPVNGKLIRPLLCINRALIEGYLTKNDIKYCIDSTNNDIEYSRNRIRKQVIPELKEINNKALEHIAAFSDAAYEAETYLEKLTEEKYRSIVLDGKINIELLSKEDEIIIKRIIKKAIIDIAEHEKDISAVHIRKVQELLSMQTGKLIDLPYGLKAYKEYEYIKISKNIDCHDGLGRIEQKIISPENIKAYPTQIYTKWFDCDKIKGALSLRTRENGDYIRIKNGTKKLQNLFTDLKIPISERDNIPLLVDGDEVVWVIGYRINEAYKVTEDTKKVVEIKYIGEKSNDRD